MDSSEQLLEAMQPWLQVLGASKIRGYYVDCVVKDGIAADHRVFEALELLALLKEIDLNAWKRALGVAWPDKTSLVEDAHPLECKLLFNPNEDEWIVSRNANEHSTGFLELRRRMEAAYAYREQDTRSFQPKPKPRDQLVVPVWITMLRQSLIESLRVLARILTIQQAVWIASESKSVEWKPLLRVQRVLPITTDDRSLSAEEMRYVSQIVEAGGHFMPLYINDVHMSETKVDVVVKGLQQLMGCRNTVTIRPAREGSTFYMNGQLTRHAIEAVYSALCTSQTIARVSLGEIEVDRHHFWHWIAYALFSRHAAHRIDRVAIPDDIRMQDIESIDELLQHPNPLALLFGNEDATAIPDSGEMVTASRFFLSSPSADPNAERDDAHHFARQQVRVIPSRASDRDEGYESVLLPGYGRAWVRQSDIEERVVSCADSRCSFGSLNCCVSNQEGMVAGLALLKRVGYSITALMVDGDPHRDVEIRGALDLWLPDALECCPGLKRWRVSCLCLNSLDTLASVFELQRSQIHDLEASDLRVLDPFTGLAFLQKLADPDHPMTKACVAST